MRIVAKIRHEMAISMTLANTVEPSYAVWLPPVSQVFFMFWMKTGPFSKSPATIIVAPVSESDLENASMNAAIKEGFRIGNVIVLDAVNGGAPRVLDACSYSIL